MTSQPVNTKPGACPVPRPTPDSCLPCYPGLSAWATAGLQTLGYTCKQSRGKARFFPSFFPPLPAPSAEQTIRIKASRPVLDFKLRFRQLALWGAPHSPEIRGPRLGPQCAESPANRTLALAFQATRLRTQLLFGKVDTRSHGEHLHKRFL